MLSLRQFIRVTISQGRSPFFALFRKSVHTHAEPCEKICWSCGKKNDCCDFFCNTCRIIQPVNQKNTCTYFEFFDLPQKFDIETKEIEKHFWELQKVLHPDKYSTKSQHEKELSAQNSSVINKAYSILKRPNLRAKYLLELHGIDALGEASPTSVDHNILLQIMETREEIAECTSLEALQEISIKNRKDIDEAVRSLAKAYDERHCLNDVMSLAIRLQYLLKISIAVEEKEVEIEDKMKK